MYKKLIITTFAVAVAGMLFGMPEISHAASGRGMSTQISARKGPGGGGGGKQGGPAMTKQGGGKQGPAMGKQGGPGGPGKAGGPNHGAPGRPGGPSHGGPGRPGGPNHGGPAHRPGGPVPPPHYVEHYHYYDNDAVAVGGAMFLLGALVAGGN